MSQNRLSSGDAAPDFTLTSDTGEQVPLSGPRGRKIIVYAYPAAMAAYGAFGEKKMHGKVVGWCHSPTTA